MLLSGLPVWSVWSYSLLLASQSLTVRSYDADASRAKSWEKATDWTAAFPSMPKCPWIQYNVTLFIRSFLIISVIISWQALALQLCTDRSADCKSEKIRMLDAGTVECHT